MPTAIMSSDSESESDSEQSSDEETSGGESEGLIQSTKQQQQAEQNHTKQQQPPPASPLEVEQPHAQKSRRSIRCAHHIHYCFYQCVSTLEGTSSVVLVLVAFVLLIGMGVGIVMIVSPSLLLGASGENGKGGGGGGGSSEAHIIEKLDKIKRWCLNGPDDGCQCVNPLEPMGKNANWRHAHDLHIETVYSSRSTTYDVVFYGDSIIEGWMETHFGEPRQDDRGIRPLYQSLFTKEGGGEFEGLALGISGDKSPNLLWRIQNGEIPPNLHTKVYWLLIGTNDFAMYGSEKPDLCSSEVVLMGILRVVEELMMRRDQQHQQQQQKEEVETLQSVIVVNGLLPRTNQHDTGQLYNPTGQKTYWDAIVEINQKLQEFCQRHANEGVVYFDATDVFVHEDQALGEGKYGTYIPKDLMPDMLHPGAEGYRLWGEKIVEKLREVT